MIKATEGQRTGLAAVHVDLYNGDPFILLLDGFPGEETIEQYLIETTDYKPNSDDSFTIEWNPFVRKFESGSL